MSRSFTTTSQSLNSPNINMDCDDYSLYCLYVSNGRCCCNSDIYFYLLTYNARVWLSSCHNHKVNINSISMFFISERFSSNRFPPQFIGTLLGIMWTAAGIFSFATYGLTRLATNPDYAWRVGRFLSERIFINLFSFRHG